MSNSVFGPASIPFEDFTRVQDAYWQCDQTDAQPHNKPPTQASEKAQPEERGLVPPEIAENCTSVVIITMLPADRACLGPSSFTAIFMLDQLQ